jgi:hypothetical protein
MQSDIPVWKEITPEVSSIPALRDHTMVLLGDHVWVHGGTDNSRRESGSLWGLHVPDDWTDMGNWTEYADQGAGPRSAHCSVVLGDRVFVWGGKEGMYVISRE